MSTLVAWSPRCVKCLIQLITLSVILYSEVQKSCSWLKHIGIGTRNRSRKAQMSP